MPTPALMMKASATNASTMRVSVNELGTRGEERNHQRRHAEIIGVALLQAERARRVAETLENMRKQDGRERDRKPDGADQHELAGKRVG